MKLSELLDVIVNGSEIRVFEYDTEQTLYKGLNLESATELTKFESRKVVYVARSGPGIRIGLA